MNQDIQQPKENLLDLRQPQKKQPPVKKKRLSRKTLYIMGVCLVVVVTALTVWLLHNKENLDSMEVIRGKVSKHLILPKNEAPALLTITDTSKISTPFLKQAENGDKLLVYQDAKKVILYRPSVDRIIDVGPVSIAAPQTP